MKAERGKQRLDKLLDINGIKHTSEASKGSIAQAYFCELFKSSNPGNFHDLFDGFQPRVNEVMNNALTAKVSDKEIKEAVFSILERMASQVCFFRNIGLLLGLRSLWKFRAFSSLISFLQNGTILNFVYCIKWLTLLRCLI